MIEVIYSTIIIVAGLLAILAVAIYLQGGRMTTCPSCGYDNVYDEEEGVCSECGYMSEDTYGEYLDREEE